MRRLSAGSRFRPTAAGPGGSFCAGAHLGLLRLALDGAIKGAPMNFGSGPSPFRWPFSARRGRPRRSR